jgi:hypothetical protein
LALGYASLAFGIEECVVAHRDVFWSGGGLWGTPASHLGLWNVVGVVVGHQDMLGSVGGLWDASASHLGLRDVVSVVVGHRDVFVWGWALGYASLAFGIEGCHGWCCGLPRRALDWGCAVGYTILTFIEERRGCRWWSMRHVRKWGRALGYGSLAFGVMGVVGVVGVVGVASGHRDMLESGGGSGICQPRIWDCGMSWVSLVVTETC